jgi:hypothetical protein
MNKIIIFDIANITAKIKNIIYQNQSDLKLKLLINYMREDMLLKYSPRDTWEI